MGSLDPKTFVDIYIGVALEAVSVNIPPTLDDFYSDIFRIVSEKTGLSKKEITYVHHAFHWVFFLKAYSPLEVVDSQGINGFTRVRLRSNPLEKSELVSRLLSEHGTWLKERMKKILN